MPDSPDPKRIAASLTASERKALMHREGGSEACMSWDTGFALYYRGLTLRNARFQRLTALGKAVRAELLSEPPHKTVEVSDER